MDRRTYVCALGSVSTLGIAGCLQDEDYDIGMTANSYVPREFETIVGSTVVWRNTSSRGHNVIATDWPDDAEYFGSGSYTSYDEALDNWDTAADDSIFNTGEEYAYTFDVPGTYTYVCLPHVDSGMTGQVIVSER